MRRLITPVFTGLLTFVLATSAMAEYPCILKYKGHLNDDVINPITQNNLIIRYYLYDAWSVNADYPISMRGDGWHGETEVMSSYVWSDYILDDKNDLISQKGTKSSVEENGYISEKPSGSEIEEESDDIKEMRMVLIEKIEELNLYMNDMNQEGSMMHYEIEKLKKRLRELR